MEDGNKKIKVGFFPYGSQKNPYQLLIKNSLEEKGIEVVQIPSSKFFPFLKLIRKDIDIIHLFWPHDFYNGKNKLTQFIKRLFFIVSLPILKIKPVLYSVENLVGHDSISFEDETRWIQKIVSRSAGLIFMTDVAVEIFRKYYTIKKGTFTEIVPHINYLSVYKNTTNIVEARQKLGLNLKKKIILTLGRITKYKGLDTLIEIFLSINDNDGVLLIAGKCSDEKYLENLTKTVKDNKTSLNGDVMIINAFIENDDLQYYFNASDAVVLNYTDIPMNPGTVVMAMGFGCCIIAPDKGTIKATVNSESYFGFIEDDANSLKNAISKVFISTDLKRLKELSKSEIVKKHNPEIVSQKIINLYSKILNKSK
jgi:beta-1,4-mannosyltransferase